MDANFDFESDAESLESDVERMEDDAEAADTRSVAIKDAIANLARDIELTDALGDNRRSAEAQEQEVQEVRNDLRERHSALYDQLQAQFEALESDRSALSELEMIGEDVSDSMAVLDSQQQWLEHCQEEMMRIGDRLDLAVEAYDLGDSSASGSMADSAVRSEAVSETTEASDNDASARGDRSEPDHPVSDFNLNADPPAVVGGGPGGGEQDGVATRKDDTPMHPRDLSFATKDDTKLTEIAAAADDHYTECEDFANRTNSFTAYAEHKWAHIQKVFEGAQEAANEFNKLDHCPEGYQRLTDADKDMLKAAALYHDTGMEGDPKNLTAILLAQGKSQDEVNAVLGGDGLEKAVRKTHGLGSALNVLHDRDLLERAGIDPDMAALDCAIHSKSNSGIADLRNRQQWESLVNQVDACARNRGVSFDRSKFLSEDGHMPESVQRQCATHGFCIRVGDANGHDMTDDELQNGSHRVIDRDHYQSGDAGRGMRSHSKEREAAANNVAIRHRDGSLSSMEDSISKQYALGEGNIRSMHMRREGNRMTEHVVVNDGAFAPSCTMFCIEERAKELATCTGMDTCLRISVDASRMTGEQVAQTRRLLNREAKKITFNTGRDFGNPIPVDIDFFNTDGTKGVS